MDSTKNKKEKKKNKFAKKISTKHKKADKVEVEE